jgi:AcrR family transcriptional regulator
MDSTAATSRGEQTRQAILEAAEKLFLSQGYNGTSMRQIARRAGIALGGIYNHFEGKEGLFQALLKERSPYDEVAAAMDDLEKGDGEHLVVEAFNRLQAIMQRNLDFVNLVLIDFQESDGSTLREVLAAVVPRALRFGRRIQEAGGLRQDVGHYMIVRAFVSLLMGYTFTQLIAYKDERPLLPGVPEISEVEARAQMIDLFLYGAAAVEGER